MLSADGAARRLTVMGGQGHAHAVHARTVVFATGINAVKQIVEASPLLNSNETFKGILNCRNDYL
jgi:hypothetical protein